MTAPSATRSTWSASLWPARPGETVQLKVRREGRIMVVALTVAASTGAGQVARHNGETQPIVVPTVRIVGVSQ